MTDLPKIIQGGMGVAISNWRLAQTVGRLGHLGVVSGTALDHVLARRLQDGDRGGHMRRAFDAFPFRAMAERVWNTYYIPGGKAPDAPYMRLPFHGLECPRPLAEVGILGNFVEVFLAREGHANPVGINYLEKIQPPHLIAIYGAMLAGVGYVLMGAGIPLKIPGDPRRVRQPRARDVSALRGRRAGRRRHDHALHAARVHGGRPAPARAPALSADHRVEHPGRHDAEEGQREVDGFIVEGPTAGGHNAPPRGKPALSEQGEPVYGERDVVDLARCADSACRSGSPAVSAGPTC